MRDATSLQHLGSQPKLGVEIKITSVSLMQIFQVQKIDGKKTFQLAS
jgi:hypothetical protein